MHPAVSAHNIANLSYFQPERRFLKWLLHLSTSKWTQVSTFIMRGAIRMNFSELRELLMRSVDLRLVASENLDSFLLRACDGRLCNVNRMSNGNATTLHSPLSNSRVACYPCASPRCG